jgi:hypothetical protein
VITQLRCVIFLRSLTAGKSRYKSFSNLILVVEEATLCTKDSFQKQAIGPNFLFTFNRLFKRGVHFLDY